MPSRLNLFLTFSLSAVVIGCNGAPTRDAPVRPKEQQAPVPLPAAPAPSWSSADTPVKPAPPVQLTAAPRTDSTSNALPADKPASPPTPPEQNLAPEQSRAKVAELAQQATTSFAAIDSYIARFRRREQVNGRDTPEEIILFKFRKKPWSVYMKWLGEQGQGREATYVQGQYEGKLHTLLANGDMLLAPAGKQLALDPDSVLIRARSRHIITEAGIGNLVDKFAALTQTDAGGQNPRLRYLGSVKRPDYETPLDAVEQSIPAGSEAALPDGGQRTWFFDPASHLPVLIVTKDQRGHEVEYYAFDRLQFPVQLDDDDFNPAKLWPARK